MAPTRYTYYRWFVGFSRIRLNLVVHFCNARKLLSYSPGQSLCLYAFSFESNLFLPRVCAKSMVLNTSLFNYFQKLLLKYSLNGRITRKEKLLLLVRTIEILACNITFNSIFIILSCINNNYSTQQCICLSPYTDLVLCFPVYCIYLKLRCFVNLIRNILNYVTQSNIVWIFK